MQNPVMLPPHSEPQPDIALLKPAFDATGPRVPLPADVLLIVEVSDTTLAYDRRAKLPLYAGIVETWIVDLQTQRIESFSAPSDAGYADHRIHARGESISPMHLGAVAIRLDEVFG